MFMKKFWEKIKSFYGESNRLYHALGGFATTFIVMVAVCVWNVSAFIGAFVATVSTLTTMVSLEVKDKDAGGKFDWKDILAGMTFPIILWIILAIVGIIMVCFPNL